jgi:uncharacterized membrane protein
VVIALDASASMKLTDSAAEKSKTRWQRVADLLLGGKLPFIKQLAERLDVELVLLRGKEVQRLWWQRQAGTDTAGPLPVDLQAQQPESKVTDLDQTLHSALGTLTAGTAVVLFSDGQHNAAGSPEELAGVLKSSGVPVFSVGLGAETAPADLALVEVTSPEAVFTSGQVQGKITVLDSMPAGLPAVVQIEALGKQLWQKEFLTHGKGTHELEYNFPLAEMPPTSDARLREFTVSVSVPGKQAELTRSNNASTQVVHVLERKRKALLLDGRARWETRYAHNHFERDERWQTRLLIDDLSSAADNAIKRNFPASREDLLTYDLVIIGDLVPQQLRPEHLEWLVEFVEKRGGGLILLDGARQGLRQWKETAAQRLLPVSWTGEAVAQGHPQYWSLTPEAERYTALRLSDSPSANAALWPQLPGTYVTAQVKPLPGSLILAKLSQRAEQTGHPGIVLRQVGAGVVLYLGSDELWRWRYQVADLYHQRLWMQLGAWIAAPPFQVDEPRVSIGSDQLRYVVGEQAELRVRLRDERGALLTSMVPRAQLWQKGRQVAELNLTADPTHPGIYRAQTPPLQEGKWQIGVTDAAASSQEKLTLHVTAGTSQELAALTLNRPLLENMARSSGGRFLREEQAASELLPLLRAAEAQQIQVREILLWSSWWWLVPLLILLTLEWVLRRRLRLI